MSKWSAWPFKRVMQRSEVVLGELLADTKGQSKQVCRLDGRPEWLFKEYLPDTTPPDAQLDRLITLPEMMEPAERTLVDANTSWPVARVVDGSRTVGVCLPHAPIGFFAEMRGVNGRTRTKEVPIDLLVQRDQRIEWLGLPVPTPADRLATCASIAAVGALFERHGLAYLDWSYANAFWDCTKQVAYVIDVDGCSFGPRWQTETNFWQDPLVPVQTMAGNDVDRYRVALLIARCLTGERDLPEVWAAVRQLADGPATAELCEQLERSLGAASLSGRRSLQALAGTLDRATNPVPQQRHATLTEEQIKAGVRAWEPVKRPRAKTPTGPVPRRPDAPVGPIRRPDQPATTTMPTRPIRVPPGTGPTPRVPARPPSNTPPPRPPARPPSRSESGRGVAVGATILALLVVIAVFYNLVYP